MNDLHYDSIYKTFKIIKFYVIETISVSARAKNICSADN